LVDVNPTTTALVLNEL